MDNTCTIVYSVYNAYKSLTNFVETGFSLTGGGGGGPSVNHTLTGTVGLNRFIHLATHDHFGVNACVYERH